MTFVPLHVSGSCVLPDDVLYRHMDAAIARGLPEITQLTPPHDRFVCLVASGPSVATQLDVIKKMQKSGTPVVGIKDAHDWLIQQGVTPDYAVAIDPQESRSYCFTPTKGVRYMIASQCHAAMFDRLQGMDVTIWHPYITKDQKRPEKRMLIGGGTTSGLRAISLFYVMGYRHFALFGFDSCLDSGVLRVNGDLPKPTDAISEVRAGNGKTYYCNPSMALQAQHFQKYFDCIPDAQFYGFGDGLIQDIIRQREEQLTALHEAYTHREKPNDRVSFIHGGGPSMASYRYRAEIPAKETGASINDLTAGTLVFAKPTPEDLWEMGKAKARGARVIVDFCDDHFDWMHYQEALRLADLVTCPTEKMAEIIKGHGREAVVIPDPYEYPELLPHCDGTNLLWYGHAVNRASLQRILPDLDGYPLRVVSNFGGTIPWSPETMLREFVTADMVVIPKTDEYKSCNRAIEATRQGCFVVAEPHPSLNHFPGIWVGGIKEGIEWARQNPQAARQWTQSAQEYVKARFSPQTVASAWRSVIQSGLTLDVEKSDGLAGSMSISNPGT